jgi:hypothetical protein
LSLLPACRAPITRKGQACETEQHHRPGRRLGGTEGRRLIETYIVDEEIPKSTTIGGGAGNCHDRAGGRQAEKLKTAIQVRRNHKTGGVTNVIGNCVGFVAGLAVQDVQEEVGALNVIVSGLLLGVVDIVP